MRGRGMVLAAVVLTAVIIVAERAPRPDELTTVQARLGSAQASCATARNCVLWMMPTGSNSPTNTSSLRIK